jgi:hypothetical protein
MPGTDLYNPLSIYDSGCTLYILVLLMTNDDESQPIAKLSRKETGPNIPMSNKDYIRECPLVHRTPWTHKVQHSVCALDRNNVYTIK